MPALFNRVTIYQADDITPMVSVSTNPADNGVPYANLIPKSNKFDDPIWAKTHGATGSNPVVTPNADVGPDGTLTAEKIVFAAPVSGDSSMISQDTTFAVTAGNTYAGQLWVKAFAAGDVGKSLVLRHVGRAAYIVITLTADWQLITRNEVAFNGNGFFGFGLTAGANGSSTGTVSILAARSMLEAGAVVHDYIENDATLPTMIVWPYLQEDSLKYGESKINFPEGSAGIGQFAFSLLDKRTVATDQTSGFFTALLSDTGGRGNILGHRAVWERQQIGGYGVYITQFDGIIDDCRLDDDLVEYTLPCRDVRERERTNRIFTKHNQTTSLVPNGPVNGWGSVPGTSMKLIPPVTPLRGQFWRDPNVPATAGRIKAVATQFDLMIDGNRYQALQQYGALTQGTGLTGGDTSLAFRNVVVWWRAYPGGGAWNVLQNMPAVVGTDYPMNNVFPLGQGVFQGAENRSFVPKNPKELVNFLVNLTGPGIPANLQQIEFMVLANGQPNEEAPIYWEGNLGQLTKDIYDGVWSNYLPGIRYDAAAMANFIAKAVQGAALITAPVENGLQWVQENTYKPQGWVPSVPPETGLVTPIQYNLPTVTEPLLNLTDSLVKEDAKWELNKDELINSVTFQYDAVFIRDSKYLTNFADKLGINANLIEPPAQRIGTLPVFYNEIAVNSQALLGAKDLSYKPETIKLFGILTPDGLDTRLWPDIGAKLAKDRTKEALDRFTFGGQKLTVNARRTGAGIAAAKMGAWVLCGVSWLPDYVSKKRGLNRIMQIVSVNDDDHVFRKFGLSDAGPNVVPSSAPVIGAITQANGVIDIPFTSIPANVFAKVDFAISVLEPAADSGQWINAGRTNVATDHITVGPFPPGTSVWIRAVGEEPGKRRSAFTASQNIVVTNAPYILGVQVTFDADGHARVSWTNSSVTLGVRIQYVTHDATVDPPAFTGTLDADATLSQVQLPVIPAFGQAITVKVTPYPGFAAGAVSGVAGAATNSITARNFGTATDISLPVVQEQTTSTSTTGTLTLVITDPQLRVTKVEFATQQANGAWSAWVQDSVLPYAASVTIPAGNQAKVAYRITGYDQTGTLNLLTQSEVVFGATTLGAPQPPSLQLTRSAITAPTVNAETITVSGGLGLNGVGPFQWRSRQLSEVSAPPAWPAFSSTALPAEITVTRGLKWQKTLDVQVTDASGLIVEETYTVSSKMDAINDNGVIDDTVPMSHAATPFKRGVDTAVDVISTSSRGFIDQAGLDINLRPISVYRGAAYEAVSNLFKRGTDSAADVVTTTTRTFVDPNAATQVDASGRIVGVFRSGVYEPVNNLMKFGDPLGVSSATSLTLTGIGPQLITLNGSPTSNLGIQVGSSSVYGIHGAMFSSGYQFISYNAYQPTQSVDSWIQSLAANPSGLFEVRDDGMAYYRAIAGKATGNKAAFWGTPLWQLNSAGAIISTNTYTARNTFMAMQVFASDGNAFDYTNASLQLREYQELGTGTEKGPHLAFHYGGVVASQITIEWAGHGGITGGVTGRIAVVNNPGTAYEDFAAKNITGTGFLRSSSYVYVDQGFGYGLVGAYDPAKWRLIYAIGSPYLPDTNGVNLGTAGGAGVYGLFCFYDDTTGTGKNATGRSMSHGIGWASIGAIKSFMGETGFWTNGDYWVNTTRVAKVMWGGGAPSGAAPAGTIYIQTS